MTQTMRPSELGLEELLTATQVAEMLRVDISTVTRWIRIGAMEATQGRSTKNRPAYLIKLSTITAMMGEK
jgi:predicted site-specific integrase-resolvase